MQQAEIETRQLSNEFPNLVMPDGLSISAIEIDVDSLSQEEKYQFGGWDDLIRSITEAWIKNNDYDGTGTIWQWGSPSVNFGHRSYSMFYAILGMPQSFRKHLSAEVRELGKHAMPYSDEVVPSLADGWDAMCHIEDRKAWEPLDPTLWQVVIKQKGNIMDRFNTPTNLVYKLPSFLEGFKAAYDAALKIKYNDYINSVECFFKTVKPVLKKSQELRKQEMPDYNIFNMLRIATREVAATAMWKDLLDPKGSHEQGDLFLRPFLTLLDNRLSCVEGNLNTYGCLPVDSWMTSAEEFVHRVHAQDKNGRIDVYLKHMSSYSAIAIEYKINAGDQKRQVYRYYKHIEAQGFEPFHVVYISPDGGQPGKDSWKGLDTGEKKRVVCISIRYELVPMLNRILKRNNQIPKKLKYFIEDYIEVAA